MKDEEDRRDANFYKLWKRNKRLQKENEKLRGFVKELLPAEQLYQVTHFEGCEEHHMRCRIRKELEKLEPRSGKEDKQ